MDQPRLSKMVRTALIRGGMEHISLGDLCREERRENEDARLLAYAAEKGTISRSEAMSLLGLSKVAAYERLRQLAERGKLVRSAANTTPPARWCRRRSSMTSSVHFWSSPVRPTGRIWRRSCTSATDSVP